MALHLYSIVISAIPRNSTLCALQDPYQCVDVTGCGFCLTSWTCMVGDENGTAALGGAGSELGYGGLSRALVVEVSFARVARALSRGAQADDFARRAV